MMYRRSRPVLEWEEGEVQTVDDGAWSTLFTATDPSLTGAVSGSWHQPYTFHWCHCQCASSNLVWHATERQPGTKAARNPVSCWRWVSCLLPSSMMASHFDYDGVANTTQGDASCAPTPRRVPRSCIPEGQYPQHNGQEQCAAPHGSGSLKCRCDQVRLAVDDTGRRPPSCTLKTSTLAQGGAAHQCDASGLLGLMCTRAGAGEGRVSLCRDLPAYWGCD
ncbi:hypothetical protein HaLaN_23639 [Haematococcus lacustris]|uniref:Uncharacterized protein n=1 Tax=Haematococcus lacustris TaxID=44745 RepID=A0A6A0A4I2_HAELA|nr:hypothetical protein HaLaN_23639 [Haematococcus lacustris]